MFTVDTAGIVFELWKANDSVLYAGYNDIGFKIYKNGTEQKTGFVKFTPIMIHSGGSSHTTPMSAYYNYDSQKSLFTGYACFLMASDSSTSFWFGDFNYNDETILRAKQFSVFFVPDFGMRFFLDNTSMILYSLTLISPKNPVLSDNDFTCILHKKNRDETYSEVDSATMFLRTWKQTPESIVYETVNPVWIGGGKYKGVVNLPGSGKWTTNDSIKYQEHFITENPPPQFYFTVN